MAHTLVQYMLTQAHTQSSPHHPWVMNNICLSIPPSLPLAWLLASSWLLCHNVILSASLSPITKMCSDNQAFLHRPLPPHQTGTRSSSLHWALIKWWGVFFQAIWGYSHWFRTSIYMIGPLFYCENVINYLVVAAWGPRDCGTSVVRHLEYIYNINLFPALCATTLAILFFKSNYYIFGVSASQQLKPIKHK